MIGDSVEASLDDDIYKVLEYKGILYYTRDLELKNYQVGKGHTSTS